MSTIFDFNTLRAHLVRFDSAPFPFDKRSRRDRWRDRQATTHDQSRRELDLRVIAIIDSMTPFERRKPLALHDESRQRRIARGAGLDVTAVKLALRRLHSAQESLRRVATFGPRPLPYTIQPASELCDRTHASLIVGTCPWCGQVVLNVS